MLFRSVFGTYKMAMASVKYGVKKFVLISTDKAVNPTNIMGASKRLCEMVVQMMNRRSPNTDFVAVRFGNVLGSNGSVIPLFKKQIAEGGPVTVTHPEITRFFMTIPEAVSLVLQAGYYAKGGEIFILDMGQPVKIDTMARNLIRLSGHEPDVDIKIVYTGLRPGEKLYEEILTAEEGLQETSNKLIHIGKPIVMDDEEFCHQLDRLEKACKAENDTKWKEAQQAERENTTAMQDAGITEITSNPEAYARYLEMQGDNPSYSAGNIALVMFGNPEATVFGTRDRSEEHTSELQSR